MSCSVEGACKMSCAIRQPAIYGRTIATRRAHISTSRRSAVCHAEDKRIWIQQVAAAGLSGAILGPMCDSLHSSHNVLHYSNPNILVPIETCWWVPLLFGLAGIIIGVSVPLLDTLLSGSEITWYSPPKRVGAFKPSWAITLVCISLFVAQYGLSGQLDEIQTEAIGPVLWTVALLHWAYFDSTAQGLALALLTAIGGPLIEIGIINGPHLYQYTHPDMYGIPLWITAVYFCGGPAVGILGRRIRASLL